MRWGTFMVACGLSATLLIGVSTPSAGQDPEPDHHRTAEAPETGEREFHPNHFDGFVGLSRHLDAKDNAFTLGLDYTRQLTTRWAVAANLESVSSDIERDVIVAVAGIYYLMPRWMVSIGPGIESVVNEVIVNGEPEQESELGLMLRAGTRYAFPLSPSAGLGPALFIDWATDRWTALLGLAMLVGF